MGESSVGVPANAGPPSTTAVKIDKVQIAAVVALSDASVRLKNCIRAGMAANELPAITVGEYAAGLPDIEHAFLALPNYGRKCATELTALIAQWYRAASNAISSGDFFKSLGIERDVASLGVEIGPSAPTPEENAPVVDPDRVRFLQILQKTKFPVCVLDQPVSVRLRNTLNEAVLSEFPADLSAVLADWKGFVEAFTKRPNVGRTTIAEMDKCIGRYIQSLLIRAGLEASDANAVSDWLLHSTSSQSPCTLNDALWQKLAEDAPDDDVCLFDARINWSAAIRKKPEEGIAVLLKAVLVVREIDVLDRRYGVSRNHSQTLDEIAQSFGITRERVRQIESKGLRKCRTPSIQKLFKLFLEASNPVAVLEDASKVFVSNEMNGYLELLSGYQRLAIDICYGGFSDWMDKHFVSISSQEDLGARGWVHKSLAGEDNLSRFVNGLDAGDVGFRRAVKSALQKHGWPISVATLQTEMPGFSAAELTRRLHKNFGAVVDGGVIQSMSRLSASMRMVLVLKDAGRPLHGSEIRARHFKLFGVDVEEHACTAVLQRLDDALIVERGVYGLYEHLRISMDDVVAVRNAAFEVLMEKGHFLSAKILQRELLQRLPPQITTELNPYIILGACQDDARFSVRRGLMIGLGLESFEETFSPLNEQVHEIIREHGPITISAVREHLGQARDILSVSVYQIFKDSPDIVAIGNGLYDVAERVFGSTDAVERFSNAIKIALVDGPCSLPIMLSRLRSVQQNSNPSLVLSYLRNAGFVIRDGALFKLRAGDALVSEYNDLFHRSRGAFEQQLDAAQRPEFRDLYNLDYRAVGNSANTAMEEEQSGVLTQLLAEFDF